MGTMKKRKRFLIIDCNSVIHRAFHALPLLTDEKGRAINAAYGFFSVLIKNVREIDPDCVAAAFDLPGPTFRHKEFKGYKAKRPPTPDDLIGQFPIVKEGMKAFGALVLEKEGFEADDIIGTVAKIVSDRGLGSSVILSGDKDNLQLASRDTEIRLLKRGLKDVVSYDPVRIRDEYGGIDPIRLIEVKALQGDASDNIPGVPGIGEKTALDLIGRFGTLEDLYDEVEKGRDGITSSVRTKLNENKDQAFMSRDLATIRTDLDLGTDLVKCRWEGIDNFEGMDFLKKAGFDTLVKRIGKVEEKPAKKNLSLF